ncbi:hypothetical protein [Legionella erythra]|uniref:Uncharacterized protein n=1 Tax=Legionella erythra TaxID=448 RepID=A0A0W0TFU5_LEGER|nr:hypothetical protein [Legionella erythra]KTC94450.1 hypothetical protein Lery_2617 [Legionella erythra]
MTYLTIMAIGRPRQLERGWYSSFAVAKEYGLNTQQLYKAAQARQAEKEKMVFYELKREYPVLDEYEKLNRPIVAFPFFRLVNLSSSL